MSIQVKKEAISGRTFEPGKFRMRATLLVVQEAIRLGNGSLSLSLFRLHLFGSLLQPF